MTPKELNRLPESSRIKKLLAISLGAKDVSLTKWFKIREDAIPQPIFTYSNLDTETDLALWKPEDDGALMWRLVCELRDSYLKDAMTEQYAAGKLWFDSRNEQALIAAYIDTDPKGLIANWSK